MTPEKSNIPQQNEAVRVPEASFRRKITFRENALMTMKLLAMMGALGAALWGVEACNAAK